jgi:hypothetical protein
VCLHGQGGQGDDDDAKKARGSDQEKEEEEDQLITGSNNFQGNHISNISANPIKNTFYKHYST